MDAEIKYRNAFHKFNLSQVQINGINYLIDRKTEDIYVQIDGINVRIDNIENNEFKITHYQIIDISGTTTGNITLPQGAVLDTTSLGSVDNSVLSTLDGSNKVTYETPKANGLAITANLSTNGSWVASDNYADPVALIYSVVVTFLDYSTWSSADKDTTLDLIEKKEFGGIVYITADYELPDSTLFEDELIVKNVHTTVLNVNTITADKLESEDTQLIYPDESFTIRLYQANDYRIV
jgi:hypothetical protein